MVDDDTLALVVASVLGGLSVTLALVSLAYQPFLLVVALPLAGGAYLMWQGATGRVGRGPFRRVAAGPGRERERRGPFSGPGPSREDRWEGAEDRRQAAEQANGRRAADEGQRRGQRAGADARRGPGPGGRRRRRRQAAGPRADTGLTPAEAYRILGLDRDADQAAVKAAYRERVKDVHPDAEGGDEEAFKRVTRAYERLTE